MHRKFSVPYSSLISTHDYMEFLSKYRNSIENVYLGIPELENHVTCQNVYTVRHNSHDFLLNSKGNYKRIVVYNPVFYNKDDNEVFKYFDTTINPLIEKYSIDGFVVTGLPIAIKLRQDFPHLELHTSCNCFQWNIRQMELWRKLAGIDVFNPPREAAKTPTMLKEMHDAGFKLKVLVNEACMYGCPYTVTHGCATAGGFEVFNQCFYGDAVDALKTNLVLPRWLEHLDEYVYCYKLSGREYPLEKLKDIFDAYILQKQMPSVYHYSTFGRKSVFYTLREYGITITDDDIPEKTRYCEARYCNTCLECYNSMIKLIPQGRL